MDAFNIENKDILEVLQVGVVGYLIMIIISTTITYWATKHIKNRSTLIIALSLTLLLFNLLFVGTNFLIQWQMSNVDNSVSSVVALIIALVITVPSGIYFKNFGVRQSGLETEIEYIDDEDFTDSVFEERRHKRRKKSHRRN